MPNNRSQAQNSSIPKKISSWDDAISDLQHRIKDLEFSLRVFRERKAKGEPWPGDESAGTAA